MWVKISSIGVTNLKCTRTRDPMLKEIWLSFVAAQEAKRHIAMMNISGRLDKVSFFQSVLFYLAAANAQTWQSPSPPAGCSDDSDCEEPCKGTPEPWCTGVMCLCQLPSYDVPALWFLLSVMISDLTWAINDEIHHFSTLYNLKILHEQCKKNKLENLQSWMVRQ